MSVRGILRLLSCRCKISADAVGQRRLLEPGPGGIRAGRQDAFFEGGNAYLATLFPNLDYIRRAVIVK